MGPARFRCATLLISRAPIFGYEPNKNNLSRIIQAFKYYENGFVVIFHKISIPNYFSSRLIIEARNFDIQKTIYPLRTTPEAKVNIFNLKNELLKIPTQLIVSEILV